MKIYFYFNIQSHTFICHEMVKYIKKKFNWNKFAGIMAVKGGIHLNYLKNQQEINYSHLDSVDDIEKEAIFYEVPENRINEWEKRLKIPLWHLVIADRNIGHFFVKGGTIPKTKIMNYTDQKNISRFICKYLDFYEKRLNEFKPNVTFFTAIASMPALALAKICEWKKIPFVVLRPTRIQDRFVMSLNDSTERFYTVENEYNTILKKNLQYPKFPASLTKYWKSFKTEKPEDPVWMNIIHKRFEKITGKNTIHFLFETIFGFVATILHKIKSLHKDNDLRYKYPLSNWWQETLHKYRLRNFDNSIFNKPDYANDKYIYFPLHLNPEASTMVLAPNFVDQEIVIDFLAKNIPMGHKLYIKEHIIMIGRRPKGFYINLKQYPNVKLIPPYENSFNIIKNADLTTVITGTAGWEALLMGKEVITFGESFYSHLGLVHQCSDMSNLGTLIKKIIFNKSDNNQERQKKIKLFLTILYNNSFKFDPKILWGQGIKPDQINEKDKKSIHTIAKELVKCMNTINNH